MISFKEFLTEARIEKIARPWKTKEVAGSEDIAVVYKTILSKCPSFPRMIQNGGILFRGWSSSRSANAFSPARDHLTVIDTTKSRRLSRDTNNFYQACLDYSPAMSAVPSRTTSLITATHVNTAIQFGAFSIIIPFENTTIAISKQEDMFWQHIGNGVGLESISIFAGDYLMPPGHTHFDVKSLDTVKNIADSWTADDIEKIKRDDHVPGAIGLFSQFKNDRFDNFCKKYITPSKLGISLYTVGDKLPATSAVRRGIDTRFSGNEAWFTGKAFSIPDTLWADLIEYAKTDLKLKVNRNCDVTDI